ncbi:MAG: hypothetical protein QW203_07365 [Thermoplasmatales archaeon]
MIPNNIIGSIFLGSAIGAIQTPLLREYADTPMAKNYLANPSSSPPFLKKQLKGFGSPSAVIGIATGVVAGGIGVYGAMRGRIIRNDAINAGLIGYGSAALFGGILSGAFPTQAWQNAVAADPANPVVSAPRSVPKPSGKVIIKPAIPQQSVARVSSVPTF